METTEDLDNLELLETVESVKLQKYYDSYNDLHVHKLMLEDKVRNEAYRDAIMGNKESFDGSVVLELGAGTGILSVICAQAGAKTVYAVEASSIYKIAEETAKENKFENVIKVIHAPIEQAEIPEKVDILVAEWMGFYLLHEGMINSLIYARDKFLKEGGLIFPENATLFSAPCSVPSYFNFWKNVHGVSMEKFSTELRGTVSKRPIMDVIDPEQLLTNPNVVVWLDLHDITLDDIKNISVKTVAVATKKGQFEGICIWFNCMFPSKSTEPVVLSTAPDEDYTHWKQTTIVFPNSYEVDEGDPMAYELVLRRSENSHREYILEFAMLNETDVIHPEYCGCHYIKCKIIRAYLDKYQKEDIEGDTSGNNKIQTDKTETDKIE